jgi:hypothetical protein
LFVVVSMGLRFELRDLPSWGRCCTAWATPSVHFALVILEMEGVSRTICWGWSRTLIFQISASQVARISSQAWAAGTWPFCFYFVFETGSPPGLEFSILLLSYPTHTPVARITGVYHHAWL